MGKHLILDQIYSWTQGYMDRVTWDNDAPFAHFTNIY